MKRPPIISAHFFFVLLTVGVGFAAAQDATKQVSEFNVNGLKVILKQRPGMPTVAGGLYIKGGSREVKAPNAGIENLMLNVAAEGSVTFPRTVLRRELAKTGSVISAGADHDYSVLSLTSTIAHFPQTWKIFADVATKPAFAKSDVELIRNALLTTLQTREDSPDSSLQMLVDRTVLDGTAYSDPLGTPDSISRFTAEDLRAYHKSVMTTSRLLLVLVGDLDAEQVKRLVTTSFSKLPLGNYKGSVIPVLDFSKPTIDITNRSLPTNYINGIFAAPSLSHPDYAAMNVAISILSGRVFEEVRVKRNLSYAPSADLGTLSANTGAIYVTAVDANQAVRVMLDEIKKLKTERVDADELVRVAAFYLTNHYLKQETSARQAADLAQYELIGGGWRNSLKFLDGVRKVTPDEVQRVARTYMKNLRFMVVGNPSAIDRSIFLQN